MIRKGLGATLIFNIIHAANGFINVETKIKKVMMAAITLHVVLFMISPLRLSSLYFFSHNLTVL